MGVVRTSSGFAGTNTVICRSLRNCVSVRSCSSVIRGSRKPSPTDGLRGRTSPAPTALFYFRRQRMVEEGEGGDWPHKRLAMLQDAVRDSGYPVSEFRDPKVLGELVYHDLTEIIRRDFSDV